MLPVCLEMKPRTGVMRLIWRVYHGQTLNTPGFLMVTAFCLFLCFSLLIICRMAIVLNALMGVASFIIGIAIIREIDKEFNYSMTMLLSLTSASYSSYLMQSNVAWAETFLYMWFLFGVWGVIRFVKHTTWKAVSFYI